MTVSFHAKRSKCDNYILLGSKFEKKLKEKLKQLRLMKMAKVCRRRW